MIFQARWQLYFWLVPVAFVLVLIERVVRTGWLGWAGLALAVCLALFALLQLLLKWRKGFLLATLYGLVTLFIISVGVSLIGSGEPTRIAAGWALVVVCTLPFTLYMLAILLALSTTLLLRIVGRRRDYYRGLVSVIKGRREKALAALTRYQREHPEDARGWEGLALSLLAARRPEEALEKADRALQLERRAEGLLFRGLILQALGASEESLSDIEAAFKLRRNLPKAFLAQALIPLRRLDDALRALEQERLWRKDPLYFLTLGEVHRLQRMSNLAFEAYGKAAKWAARDCAPNPSAAKQVMAYALAEQAKLEQAEKAVRSLLSQDPSDTMALLVQALIQRQRGDYAGVETTLQRILPLNPNEVVGTLTDPDFSPLLVEERFRRLLGQALEERERILERVRNRAQPDPDYGAPGLQPV